MKDNARLEIMRDLRSQGLSYEEIGREMGISKQRVYQLIGGYTKHSVIVRPEQCVYPAIRFWMLENNVSFSGFSRMMYGQLHNEQRGILCNALKGSNCSKSMIDKILKITGLTYEVAFERSVENGN